MVDVNIGGFDPATSMGDTDILYLGQGGLVDKKITFLNFKGSLSITASQVSDFDTEVANNSTVASSAAFTATPSTVITAGTGLSWTGNTLNASGGSVAWGGISGTLSDQTDLQTALNAKQATITNSDDISEGSTNLFLTATERSNIITNNAKVSNATHSGDATGSTTLTLATVNANVGSFTNANITVNAKGLITAAANGSAGSSSPLTTKGDLYTYSTTDARLPVGTNDYVLVADSSTATGLKWAANSAGFSDPMTTRGDIIIRNASNTTTRLGVGTNGQYLKSDGTDISWATVAGGGDVTKVGTPVDNQLGVWTGDGTIEGSTSLTYDGVNLHLAGDIGATGDRVTKGWFVDLQVTNAIAGSITGNAATVSTITGLAPDTATTQATQAGITTCVNLTTVGTIGSGVWQGTAIGDTYISSASTWNAKAPTTSPTFATSITGSFLTASEILITDASKNIVSAPVATYPSLTELSYVKGLTSAVQSQLNAKGTLSNVSEDTTPELGGEMDAGAHSIGFTLQTATGDGTTTIDWKLGNKFKFTFGAFNETFTFTAPSNPCTVQLILVQDSVGSRTATWPASVKWPLGTAPTLTTTATTGTDIVSLFYDGTNYYGTSSADFS